MAESTVETIVANPAGKRRRSMAKRMSLRQRLHFGSSRQRAAARRSLRSKRSSRSSHRRRTHNPGEIIAMTLGNPARRRNKRMAATKKRRRRTSSAGSRRRATHHSRPRRMNARRPRHRARTRHLYNPARRRVYNVVRHHRRRHNPAGYRWSDVFVLGAGGVVGSTLSSASSQLVLGASNSGMVGYLTNLAATLVLSWLGGMVTRNRAFPAGILAGGIGSLIRRIIADYSLFGTYSASLGMGDYMVSNWVTPQRLSSDFRSLIEANVDQGYWGAQPRLAPALSSSGVSTRGMGLEGDPGYSGAYGN